MISPLSWVSSDVTVPMLGVGADSCGAAAQSVEQAAAADIRSTAAADQECTRCAHLRTRPLPPCRVRRDSVQPGRPSVQGTCSEEPVPRLGAAWAGTADEPVGYDGSTEARLCTVRTAARLCTCSASSSSPAVTVRRILTASAAAAAADGKELSRWNVSVSGQPPADIQHQPNDDSAEISRVRYVGHKMI